MGGGGLHPETLTRQWAVSLRRKNVEERRLLALMAKTCAQPLRLHSGPRSTPRPVLPSQPPGLLFLPTGQLPTSLISDPTSPWARNRVLRAGISPTQRPSGPGQGTPHSTTQAGPTSSNRAKETSHDILEMPQGQILLQLTRHSGK